MKICKTVKLVGKSAHLLFQSRTSATNTKSADYILDLYKELMSSFSKSLLKRHLTETVFERLRTRTTVYQSTLVDVIQSGLRCLDSDIGAYAPDPDAYAVFGDLLRPILKDYHRPRKGSLIQPSQNFGDKSAFCDIDPYNHFILSTRIRACRNIEGYPFTPVMTVKDFEELNWEIQAVLKKLPRALKGIYTPMESLTYARREALTAKHMYKNPSRFVIAANILNHWPKGRGYFHTTDNKFQVWINMRDHLHIVSMQQGADFGEVYKRFVHGHELINSYQPFERDERLGSLTVCPSAVGSSVRASVLIQLNKLAANINAFNKVLKKFDLEVRGTYGINTPVVNRVYDISNRSCFGKTEFDCVYEVYEGAKEIMKMEKCAKSCCELG